MNRRNREVLAKVAGDSCGSLASISVGFAVFVIVLSLAVEHYRVEVWAIVSIMVGIALGCLFTRVSLLLSHCKNCTPNSVFAPVIKWMAIFCVVGVVSGSLLAWSYNEDWRNEMCSSVAAGLEKNATPYMTEQCPVFMHNVQQLLDYTLIVFPVVLVVMVTAQSWRRLSRHRRGGAAILR